MSRDNHDALIDAYTDALNRWMKIVDRNNAHKPPISQEPAPALTDGREQEQIEVERGFAWVKKFGRNPEVVVGLELADYNRYALEELRRLGAFEDNDKGGER